VGKKEEFSKVLRRRGKRLYLWEKKKKMTGRIISIFFLARLTAILGKFWTKNLKLRGRSGASTWVRGKQISYLSNAKDLKTIALRYNSFFKKGQLFSVVEKRQESLLFLAYQTRD
jgi:hypothetical protein